MPQGVKLGGNGVLFCMCSARPPGESPQVRRIEEAGDSLCESEQACGSLHPPQDNSGGEQQQQTLCTVLFLVQGELA